MHSMPGHQSWISSRAISLPIVAGDLRSFGEERNEYVAESGTYGLHVGSSSRAIRLETSALVGKR